MCVTDTVRLLIYCFIFVLISALCLLNFNTVDEMSLEELKEATNIEEGELKRTMQVHTTIYLS